MAKAKRRNKLQLLYDTVVFPARAILLIDDDRFGAHSLMHDRYEFAANHSKGHCLDIGCGRYDKFIQQYHRGTGQGIDVFPYEGLKKSQIFKDLKKFPFKDKSYDTVTFIGCINHIPAEDRLTELKEARRVLKPGGKVLIQMGLPLPEILMHKWVAFSDAVFKSNWDVDTQRGMKDSESYFITNKEIRNLVRKAGFPEPKRKRFVTQWGVNSLYISNKKGKN